MCFGYQVFWLFIQYKIIVILGVACVNSSIFCATDTGTASVRYLGESHLASLVTMALEVSLVSLYFCHWIYFNNYIAVFSLVFGSVSLALKRFLLSLRK